MCWNAILAGMCFEAYFMICRIRHASNRWRACVLSSMLRIKMHFWISKMIGVHCQSAFWSTFHDFCKPTCFKSLFSKRFQWFWGSNWTQFLVQCWDSIYEFWQWFLIKCGHVFWFTLVHFWKSRWFKTLAGKRFGVTVDNICRIYFWISEIVRVQKMTYTLKKHRF